MTAAPRPVDPAARFTPGTTRSPRLDGLRGLAIGLVMLYHTTHYQLAERAHEVALTLVPSVGWSGVDLFFVLSGFLITGILLRAKHGAHYFRSFYARRVLRIFPLYYAVLAFFFLLVPRIELFRAADFFWLPGAERESVWFWAYLSNLQVARTGAWQHHGLSIAWSLAIEEHFYLAWPLLVRFLSERRLLLLCGLLFAGALAARAWVVAAGASPLIAYTATPCRLDTLATGAALAVLFARPGGPARLARAARLLLPGALLLFAGLYTYVRLATPAAATPGAPASALRFLTHPLNQTAGYTLLCVIYGALLVSVLTAPARSWRARVFELDALQGLGKVSYALYLFHFFVALLALSVLTPGNYPGQFVTAQLAFWMLAFGASYGLARLSWALVESPALRLKRHFPYGGAPPAAAAGAGRA